MHAGAHTYTQLLHHLHIHVMHLQMSVYQLLALYMLIFQSVSLLLVIKCEYSCIFFSISLLYNTAKVRLRLNESNFEVSISSLSDISASLICICYLISICNQKNQQLKK